MFSVLGSTANTDNLKASRVEHLPAYTKEAQNCFMPLFRNKSDMWVSQQV